VSAAYPRGYRAIERALCMIARDYDDSQRLPAGAGAADTLAASEA